MKDRAAWHKSEYDSTWERVKAAFRNDWEQTKSDFGVESARDIDQDADDTVKQMMGRQSTVRYDQIDYEEAEGAFRYGHAAHSHFRDRHPTWTEELAAEIRGEYPNDWQRDEPLIAYAYNYNYSRL